MKRIRSLILCLCLMIPMLPALAEEAALSIEPVEETIYPGKAILLTFTVPEEGLISLHLMDEGENISTVVEDYQAAAGRNQLWWNGTYEGVFAPEGTWQLELYAGENVASVPVTIGAVAPYLTNISSDVDVEAQRMTVSFYASVEGLLSVGVVANDAWAPVETKNISAGENTYVWDMSAADPATSTLTLMLLDATGAPSNEERIPVTPEDFGLIPEEPTEEPTEVPTEEPEPTAEPDPEEAPDEITDPDPEDEGEPPEGDDLFPDEIDPDELPEEELIDVEMEPEEELEPVVYTPAHGSPYEGQDASLNYWTMPMDITDEEAVWNVLMQPMTILYSSKDKADRTQVILREEPDENSRGVGVVTRINQGVHVLEHLDNGWSLIECYSASFHDSAVKAWNMLVQGYVRTDQLKTVEPQQKYGLVIDKLTQRLYVFRNGHLYTTLLVSTGLANESQPYNETRSGEFFLTSAVGAFASGNLTCAMAIRFDSGDLLHEVPHKVNGDGSRNYGLEEPNLGMKASHGCVRVQRRRTPEGVNMAWLWDNRVKNTKILIWEDWQGRQIAVPDDDLILYYNPNGGSMYHSQETCYSAEGKKFTAFTYGELEQEPYSKLTRCGYCAPALREAEIKAINEIYAPGGDHDPILTEARRKYLESLEE